MRHFFVVVYAISEIAWGFSDLVIEHEMSLFKRKTSLFERETSLVERETSLVEQGTAERTGEYGFPHPLFGDRAVSFSAPSERRVEYESLHIVIPLEVRLPV